MEGGLLFNLQRKEKQGPDQFDGRLSGYFSMARKSNQGSRFGGKLGGSTMRVEVFSTKLPKSSGIGECSILTKIGY